MAETEKLTDDPKILRKILVAWIALQLRHHRLTTTLDDFAGVIKEMELERTDNIQDLATGLVVEATEHCLKHHKPVDQSKSAGDLLAEMIRHIASHGSGGAPPIRKG